MKTLAIVLAFATAPMLVNTAVAAPFEKGDPKAGQATHDKQCKDCHVAKFGGDGSKIYTRANRRVKSASGLSQQVTTCNSMLGNQLFPEDELHLSAYLNGQFYKFK